MIPNADLVSIMVTTIEPGSLSIFEKTGISTMAILKVTDSAHLLGPGGSTKDDITLQILRAAKKDCV